MKKMFRVDYFQNEGLKHKSLYIDGQAYAFHVEFGRFSGFMFEKGF